MLTSDALTAMTIDLGQMTRKILNRSDGFLLFRVVCILIILQASLHHPCDSSLNERHPPCKLWRVMHVDGSGCGSDNTTNESLP
jgi:hypothetical protein